MSLEFTSYSGAKVKINDPSFIGTALSVEKSFINEAMARHEKAKQDGIVAYRPIDGWVDTKKCTVTFFDCDTTKGWYWSNHLDIKEGDKIGLDLDEKEWCIAVVDKIIRKEYYCIECHYTIIKTKTSEDMKPVIKYKIYRVFLSALIFVPLAICFIPICLLAPFAWGWEELCKWRDSLCEKMRKKLHLDYFYNRDTKKTILKKTNEE